MGKRFTEYSQFDLSQVNKDVLKKWDENQVFAKSMTERDGCPSFVFFEGPPSANGMPGIHHVMARTIKDIFCRYKTMKGYQVKRKAGWDTHGLPVELSVEKALGITKEDIGKKISVADYNAACRKDVMKYTKEWEDLTHQMGYWVDMKHPYITYDNRYIETLWWLLKQLHKKGLLYKGYTIQPYSPAAGTGLSSHELNQPGCYRDVKDTTMVAQFKMKNPKPEMAEWGTPYFLAWTTTPWTLPSNVILSVNANETYVKAKYQDYYVIMAEALLDSVLGEGNYEVVESMKGGDLEYVKYEPLFDFQPNGEDFKGYFVTCDDYVTLTDGTGIVHTAYAYGEDDYRVCKKYDVTFYQNVDTTGHLNSLAGPFEGLFVKDADPVILKYMEENGTLFAALPFEHNYPFCWRCDTPLLYYARSTWFIKMTALRDNLVRNNRTINWYPDNIKEGRFGNFLENVIDWGLSRERYWGTPLPIWECECGHRHTIGSIAELKEMSPDCPDNIELHKPFIDAVHITCPKCGKLMTRVPEVIDCWFDSGSMPFAQWHYPFENKDIFDENFPADFISEAVDQTRGWFYTLLAVSTLLFDKAPYKNCIVLGHVQDKDGQKMSKHKGNVVNPWDALNKQGADAVRWYFYANSAPWLPSRYYDEAVSEMQRKFMGTLWNTYAFYILYAEIDQFDPTKYTLDYEKLAPMDKWILSKLQTLNKFVDESLEGYKLTEPARAMVDFLDDLSNWYVRRSRERFWAEGMEQDKINAYMTLYTVLETMVKLAAPFTPFITEEIYGNLVKKVDASAPESVHLCDWPAYHAEWVDADLEENMDFVLKVVVEGRAARNASAMKNRQPLAMMYVKATQSLPAEYCDIIKDELNVKAVSFTDDVEAFTTYTFKPQLRTLGKKYGKLVPAIGAYLKEVEGNGFMAQLKADGKVSFTVDGSEVVLEMDDVLVDTAEKDGFVSSGDNNLTVVLDTNLTPELVEEGFVREIVSKVQTMRKEADFNVTDRIRVYYDGNARIAEILAANDIKGDVLAVEVVAGKGGELSKEWNINGEKVTLGVARV